MWDYIINIYPSELLCIKTNESRINEHKIFFLKLKNLTIYIFYLNILTGLFKELKIYIKMTINNI